MQPGKHENNRVHLQGVVSQPLTYSHTIYEEDYSIAMVEVPRLSGVSDILPVTIAGRLLRDEEVGTGMPITVEGQLRSYNKEVDGANRLILTVFARALTLRGPRLENPNLVELDGYLCRPPVYRTTPFMREITDLLLAVNRPFGKSDYIPAIAWGKNARFARSFQVGDRIQVVGRFQSREYQKQQPSGVAVKKVAFELSVGAIHAVPKDAPPHNGVDVILP